MKLTLSCLLIAIAFGTAAKDKTMQSIPVYIVKIYRTDGSIIKGKYLTRTDNAINVFTQRGDDTLHLSINFSDIKKIKTRKQGSFLVIAKWTGLCLASGGLIYGLTQIKSSGKSGTIPASSPDALVYGVIIVAAVFVYPFYELSTYFAKKKYPWQFQ